MYICSVGYSMPCSAEVIMASFAIAKFSAAVAEFVFSRTAWASELLGHLHRLNLF